MPELAEDIEHLVRLAYPDATPLILEVLAKDQFVDLLLHEDIRLHVRQHACLPTQGRRSCLGAGVLRLGEQAKMYWAQWDSLQIQDGVLYRVWETPADQSILQLVLPKKLRPRILQQLHDTATGGHFGVAKTLGKVRERFYWVSCRKDIQEWCRSCDLCASRKDPHRKAWAPMGQYNVGTPMERIAIDVLGPLPLSDSGNRFLLLVVDYFTKWPEAFAIPNQEAPTFADVLVKEMVCRFGVPLYIHSDQGHNFESTVFSEMCRMLGIKKTRTTPLHPQGADMVEWLNHSLAHSCLLPDAHTAGHWVASSCVPSSAWLERILLWCVLLSCMP